MPTAVPDAHFFATIGGQQIVLVPRKTAGIEKFGEIKGKRIAYFQGGRFDKLTSARTDFTRVALSTTDKKFQLLSLGRIDAVITNMVEFNNFRGLHPSESGMSVSDWDLLGAPVTVAPIEISFAASRAYEFPNLIPTIKDYVSKARAEGRFEPLFRKWGEPLGGKCELMQSGIGAQAIRASAEGQ